MRLFNKRVNNVRGYLISIFINNVKRGKEWGVWMRNMFVFLLEEVICIFVIMLEKISNKVVSFLWNCKKKI